MEFNLITDDYTGPFDIFLQLIEKKKMSIINFNISSIIDEYLEYTKDLEFDNLQMRSEFLTMASHLIHIKSSEVIYAENARKEKEKLKIQIVDYALVKDAAKKFKKLENVDNISYSVNEIKLFHNIYEEDNSSLNVDNLKKALFNCLQRVKKEKPTSFLEVSIQNNFNYEDVKENLFNTLKKEDKTFNDILEILNINDSYSFVSLFLMILEEYKRLNIDIVLDGDNICLKIL